MRILTFSAALLLSTNSLASVAIDGWYAEAFGGATYLPDNVDATRYGLHRSDVSWDSGYNAGGRVGLKCTPLRYEGEVTYVTADVDHFQLNSLRQMGVTGDNNAVFAMANIYYDFPEMVPAVAPYIGLGIGYGHINVDLNANGPFIISRFSASDSVFAYQGTAGFSYNFCENWSATIAYRFIATDRPDALGKVYQANLGTAGIVYRFDGLLYK